MNTLRTDYSSPAFEFTRELSVQKRQFQKRHRKQALFDVYFKNTRSNIKKKKSALFLFLQSSEVKICTQSTEISNLLLDLLTGFFFLGFDLSLGTLESILKPLISKPYLKCNFNRSIKNLFSSSAQSCPIRQNHRISHKPSQTTYATPFTCFSKLPLINLFHVLLWIKAQ